MFDSVDGRGWGGGEDEGEAESAAQGKGGAVVVVDIFEAGFVEGEVGFAEGEVVFCLVGGGVLWREGEGSGEGGCRCVEGGGFCDGWQRGGRGGIGGSRRWL